MVHTLTSRKATRNIAVFASFAAQLLSAPAGAMVIVAALSRDVSPMEAAAAADAEDSSTSPFVLLRDAVSSALARAPWEGRPLFPDPARFVDALTPSLVGEAASPASGGCLRLKWQDYRHAGVAQLCDGR